MARILASLPSDLAVAIRIPPTLDAAALRTRVEDVVHAFGDQRRTLLLVIDPAEALEHDVLGELEQAAEVALGSNRLLQFLLVAETDIVPALRREGYERLALCFGPPFPVQTLAEQAAPVPPRRSGTRPRSRRPLILGIGLLGIAILGAGLLGLERIASDRPAPTGAAAPVVPAPDAAQPSPGASTSASGAGGAEDRATATSSPPGDAANPPPASPPPAPVRPSAPPAAAVPPATVQQEPPPATSALPPRTDQAAPAPATPATGAAARDAAGSSATDEPPVPPPPPQARPPRAAPTRLTLPSGATVRATPKGLPVGSLPRGSVVQVYRTAGRWLLVGQHGPAGWIYAPLAASP